MRIKIWLLVCSIMQKYWSQYSCSHESEVWRFLLLLDTGGTLKSIFIIFSSRIYFFFLLSFLTAHNNNIGKSKKNIYRFVCSEWTYVWVVVGKEGLYLIKIDGFSSFFQQQLSKSCVTNRHSDQLKI